jgi:hypothetical protein
MVGLLLGGCGTEGAIETVRQKRKRKRKQLEILMKRYTVPS